jgi:hypothetical protein
MTNNLPLPLDDELVRILRTNWMRIQQLKRSDEATLEFEPIWAIINAAPAVIARLSNHEQFERDCEAEELETALQSKDAEILALRHDLERVMRRENDLLNKLERLSDTEGEG